mmetsp:Transcript_9281/g.22823  ORF Transcript_9281/g.22823 Transcript_9281/m.22823 type:complete len:235 (+) Transcript_9281:1148-1852(+)
MTPDGQQSQTKRGVVPRSNRRKCKSSNKRHPRHYLKPAIEDRVYSVILGSTPVLTRFTFVAEVAVSNHSIHERANTDYQTPRSQDAVKNDVGENQNRNVLVATVSIFICLILLLVVSLRYCLLGFAVIKVEDRETLHPNERFAPFTVCASKLPFSCGGTGAILCFFLTALLFVIVLLCVFNGIWIAHLLAVWPPLVLCRWARLLVNEFKSFYLAVLESIDALSPKLKEETEPIR